VSVLPRSLVGRNLLLIALLIVFAQGLTALAFVRFVTLPRLEPFAAYARQHAEAIALALGALPADARAAYAGAIDRGGPARVLESGREPASLEIPRRPAVRLFVRVLRARLPADYRVGWQEAGQTLWIGVPAAGSGVWVGFPAADLVPRFGAVAIGTIVGAGGLALLGAYALQRRIDRPLRELVGAARAVGAGRPAPPLDETGPREIAEVSRAFNAMARDLDALDRDRAVMLAGVSHDLRTPLAKIRLALELIGPGADPSLRESIVRSVESANRVIDQFVAFGRTGSDEPVVETDLSALARAVIADAGPAAGVTLDAGRVPPLRLRPQAMRRLLANLVDNALKYAGAPVTVRIRADTGGVTLSVFDQGPGIAADDAQRLKQPFVRASAARADVPGAGLGLAIVDRIARMHGARFDLLAGDGPRERPGLQARVTLPLKSA
jgi:two-component system osmolarity sensor histidine kinase EnvZ